MPIYEFKCPQCNQRFDEFFYSSRLADDEGATCPVCQTPVRERLISLSASAGGEDDFSGGASCGSGGFT